MIKSLMQDVPLTLNLMRERMDALYRNKSVVTRYPHQITRASYGALLDRAAQLAGLLRDLGVEKGDPVGTLAWNSQRHLELYVAVPCSGAVLHTINGRLAGSDVRRLIEHAGDRVLFVDFALLPVLAAAGLPACLRHIIVLEDTESVTSLPPGECAGYLDYETELARFPVTFDWPELDEQDAAGLCYTSGTTGRQKGVVYSHRSTLLHSLACLFADGIAMRERDVCMPAVPMFHANAWGFPFAAMMAGASLALPWRQIDPVPLTELVEAAGVTVATAVPTVWLNVVEAIRSGTVSKERLRTLKRIPAGGAAVGRELIRAFDDLGIEMTHCWGMTEISPLGLVNVVRSTLSESEASLARETQGLPIPCCSVRTIDDDGVPCAHDGISAGELQIRSPWAAEAYFDPSMPDNRLEEADGSSSFSHDNKGRKWLRTGDVATIDPNGYVRLVDRKKDLIKSGGEWISSLMLEERLLEHAAIREAAVVARPDPVWQERPVAFLSLRDDQDSATVLMELRESLMATLPKWQVPEDIAVLPELPKGLTGKTDKIALRTVARSMFDRSTSAGLD